MTVDRLAQTRLLLEEMIRTAERADAAVDVWDMWCRTDDAEVNEYMQVVPPDRQVLLARADLATLDEHVADLTAEPRCWGDHAGATPSSPCAVVERIVNKWIGETK